MAPIHFYVLNRGGLPATRMGSGTAPEPPFAWADGGFPGGVGSLAPPAAGVPYCSTTLGVNELCVLTLTFTPTDAGMYTGAANVAYSDALGPVTPNANRNIQGTCTTHASPP